MIDTYRICKLLEMIVEKANKGATSLKYLFVLEDDIAVKFAKLGYHVTTVSILDYDSFNCYSEISWLKVDEKGKYEIIDFKDDKRMVSVHEVIEKNHGIMARDAKKIAYEVQKNIIEQNVKLYNSFSVNFEIYPELRLALEQSFDITVNSSDQVTFLNAKY